MVAVREGERKKGGDVGEWVGFEEEDGKVVFFFFFFSFYD